MSKTVATVFILVCTLAVLAGLRDRHTASIVEALPFCGGHSPGIADWAALVVVLITLGGVSRLLHPAKESDDDDEYEEIVQESTSEEPSQDDDDT